MDKKGTAAFDEQAKAAHNRKMDIINAVGTLLVSISVFALTIMTIIVTVSKNV